MSRRTRAAPPVGAAKVSNLLRGLVGDVPLPPDCVKHVAGLYYHSKALQGMCAQWRVHVHLSGASTKLSTQWFGLHETSFEPYPEIGNVQGIVFSSVLSRQLLAVGSAALSGRLKSDGGADPSSSPSAIPFRMAAEAVTRKVADDKEADPGVCKLAPPTPAARAADPISRGVALVAPVAAVARRRASVARTGQKLWSPDPDCPSSDLQAKKRDRIIADFIKEDETTCINNASSTLVRQAEGGSKLATGAAGCSSDGDGGQADVKMLKPCSSPTQYTPSKDAVKCLEDVAHDNSSYVSTCRNAASAVGAKLYAYHNARTNGTHIASMQQY